MAMVPRIAGDYETVYRPGGDVFPGPDSRHLKAGQWYEHWVPNDHCFVKGVDDRWHMFGITHPATPPGPESIHEGEWQAFHAVSDRLSGSQWHDLPKVLPPAARPGERSELYAPFVVERSGVYHMFYGPGEMRLATSRDLLHWIPMGAVFTQEGGARDPCVLWHEDRYWMVYVAGASIFARHSADLRYWSETPVEIFRMRRKGAPESPVLLAREGAFYLFWCLYDGECGPYDNRTFVYRSSHFSRAVTWELVGQLEAHAPEIVRDDDGLWYVSSVEWPSRGVSIARLEWS